MRIDDTGAICFKQLAPREGIDFFLENISVSVSRASYISPLKRKIFRLVDIMLLIFEHFSQAQVLTITRSFWYYFQ